MPVQMHVDTKSITVIFVLTSLLSGGGLLWLYNVHEQVQKVPLIELKQQAINDRLTRIDGKLDKILDKVQQ